MTHKISILLLFVLLFSQSTKATELKDYIPSDATLIVRINFNNLNTKSKGENYLKYLQDILPGNSRYSYYNNCNIFSVKDMMSNPLEFGVNLKSEAYIYQKQSEFYSGTTYLITLDDAKKFESKIGNDDYCHDPAYFVKKQTEEGTFFFSEKIVIGISQNIAFIFINDKSKFTIKDKKREVIGNEEYYYGGDDYGYDNRNSYKDSTYYAEMEVYRLISDSLLYVKINTSNNTNYYNVIQDNLADDNGITDRAKARFQKIKEAELAEKFEKLLNDFKSICKAATTPIYMDRNYARLVKDNNDVVVFINNPIAQMSKIMNPFSQVYYSQDFNQAKNNTMIYSKNISAGMTLNFENGNVRIKTYNSFGDEAFKHVEAAYKKKQNKDLFKYIDGTNMMAFASISVNTKEMSKFYENFYFELLDNSSVSRSEYNISPTIQLIWSLIDKEMIYGTFSDRQIIAVNGFLDAKISYNSYEYDEDFVSRPVVKEKTIKQPKVVWVLGVDNKEYAKKLFDIIGKFTVFTKVKENVISLNSSREVQFNLYIVLTEDAFIITNDPVLALEKQSGFDKGQLMTKEEQKFILSHNFAMKVYSSKILSSINQNYPSSSRQMREINEMAANLGDLTLFNTEPKDNSISMEAVLSLTNSSDNSLSILLNLLKRL
ncbi:MAG: DUF4836 family protein [Bacteroidia bacterium]|nr:DUF4836 family protein [Bacteroidia bacterium]